MEMRKSISTTTSPEVKAEKILPIISDCYTEYAALGEAWTYNAGACMLRKCNEALHLRWQVIFCQR